MQPGAEQGDVEPVALGDGDDGAKRPLRVVDELVEVLARKLEQRAAVRQDPVGIRERFEHGHEHLVDEVHVGIGQLLDVAKLAGHDVLQENLAEHLADELGRRHVRTQHPTVVDAPLAVPALDWTVAPGAVGDADRGQVKHNTHVIGIDRQVVSKQRPKRCTTGFEIAPHQPRPPRLSAATHPRFSHLARSPQSRSAVGTVGDQAGEQIA